VEIDNFEVSNDEIKKSIENLSKKLKKSLEVAIDRVFRFYKEQPINSWVMDTKEGKLGQIIKPIEKVGIYIPGGTAPLLSSVYMSTIPAIVAGCKNLILTSPPDREGNIPVEIKAVCRMLQKFKISLRLFKIGGAQAIAAMALGTELVPRVDKVVGAGNIYVNLAKRLLYGLVGVDGIAGPTEALIIADETADKRFIAYDFLAQAEHDPLAVPIILTHSSKFAEEIKLEISKQLPKMPRKEIILQSINKKGGIIITRSLDNSIQLSNEFAPEHLSLMVKTPQDILPKISNAGGIFIGDYSCEVLGDYIAGPSHVMPTSSAAKYRSALSVLDFVKFINIIELKPNKAKYLCSFAKTIAEAEKLNSHAMAAKIREGRK
jgi:histidinol dehydrogenase